MSTLVTRDVIQECKQSLTNLRLYLSLCVCVCVCLCPVSCPPDLVEAEGRPNVISMHPDFRMLVLANRPGFPFLGNDFFGSLGITTHPPTHTHTHRFLIDVISE